MGTLFAVFSGGAIAGAAVASVFAEDVVLWSDGGGVARAARHPLFGAERVARHLVGVAPQTPDGTEVRIVRVNGDPAIVGVLDGQVTPSLVECPSCQSKVAPGLLNCQLCGTAVRAETGHPLGQI